MLNIIDMMCLMLNIIKNLFNIKKEEEQVPKILNHLETLDYLLNSNCSLVRIGDGELTIIKGYDIPFQKTNKILANRLKSILHNEQEDLLVGINYEYYNTKELKNMHTFVKKHIKKNLKIFKENLNPYLNFNSQYCSAGFTQLGQAYKNFDFEFVFNSLRQLWKNRKIVIVGCEKAKEDLEYNIYDNASEVIYLYVPALNAFDEYEAILNATKKYSKDYLILLMCGPTAKVLVSDLTQCGYRALDLGHLAKDYDWYKRKIPFNSKNCRKFCAPDV